MERRVVIIGAGISGLLACKYTIAKGFNPIVLEAESSVGGVWFNNILRTTHVQCTRDSYRFSDFDWPPSPTGCNEGFPHQSEAREYIKAYAHNFGLLSHIRLNCRVTGIEYVGVTQEEMEGWDQWGGTGTAFGSRGKWHVSVHNKNTDSIEVHEAEFVILCIGRFSGLPNIPEPTPGHSRERFQGKVLHSMEYSALEDSEAEELIKGKRVTVIGSGKSAMDIAAECADANGSQVPCTMIQRTIHWFVPDFSVWRVISFFYANRFGELLVHMPGESFMHSLLATILSPIKWIASTIVEVYIRWKNPLKKYGMIPKLSFLEDLSGCTFAVLPRNFYEKVGEESIILKRSERFGYVEDGIIIDKEDQPIRSDVVILATGYRGEDKLRNIFKSPIFQQHISRSPCSTPAYRHVINPHIPGLAIIGYAETISNLPLFEVRCRWLAEFLDGHFKFPSIKEMEKDTKLWEDYMKRYAGKNHYRSCLGLGHIWANDQLCRDIGCNPRRKTGFLAELFDSYGPMDYLGMC